MSDSRLPRKRKHEQETGNTDRNEDGHSSKHTREDDLVDKCVPNDSQPKVPPALSESPIPIRSDIVVTTGSRTATSTKKKKVSTKKEMLSALDQSSRPESCQADSVVDDNQSAPELDALRSRIQELEEERDDYHDSLQKETEKAMERGRQLLLFQAGAATTKQCEDSSTAPRHQTSRNDKNEGDNLIIRPLENARRDDTPTGQSVPSRETTVPRGLSMHLSTVLEGELQRKVDDLSTRLSEAESEIADRVAQVLKLFKYKWQDEQFAAQSRLMRTEDCKLAQATEEPTSDPGEKKISLQGAPKDGLGPPSVSPDSTDVELLRKKNQSLSEKLRTCCDMGSKFKAEVQKLRTILEMSVRSRNETASALREATHSHAREKLALEDRIRSLESDIAQARLKIEQLNDEKTGMASLQDLVNERAKTTPPEGASRTRGRQNRTEWLEGLEARDEEPGAENTSLAVRMERIHKLDLSASHSQLCTAESMIILLQTKVQNLESVFLNAGPKQADAYELEVRVKELSESLSKVTIEVAKRDEALVALRAASLEIERALQKAQQDHQSTVEELAAKTDEASKARAEINRLRRFEYAVREHDRAVKRLGEGREEMLRQQKEQMSSLVEARAQIMQEKERNRELRVRNEALERREREPETAKREDEVRFTQFLQSVQAQIERQIEEAGGESDTTTKIGRPDDATLKQLEARLQKKLDMIERELQWYKDNRARIHSEYRQLEQWRDEMASNVAARLGMINGPRQARG